MKTWSRIYQQQFELESYQQALIAQSAAAAADAATYNNHSSGLPLTPPESTCK